MKLFFLGALAILLTSACTLPEQSEMAIQREQEQEYYNRCLSYGATPDTPAFTRCMSENPHA